MWKRWRRRLLPSEPQWLRTRSFAKYEPEYPRCWAHRLQRGSAETVATLTTSPGPGDTIRAAKIGMEEVTAGRGSPEGGLRRFDPLQRKRIRRIGGSMRAGCRQVA